MEQMWRSVSARHLTYISHYARTSTTTSTTASTTSTNTDTAASTEAEISHLTVQPWTSHFCYFYICCSWTDSTDPQCPAGVRSSLEIIINQLQVVAVTTSSPSAALRYTTVRHYSGTIIVESQHSGPSIICLFQFQMKVDWIKLFFFLFFQIEKVENDLRETRLAKQFLINVVGW